MAEKVGEIYSEYRLDTGPFNRSLAETDRRIEQHGRAVVRTAANSERAFNRTRQSIRAPANSLDGLNSKLAALNKRLQRTEAGSAAFNRLAARAANARTRIDAVNRSAALAGRQRGGLDALSGAFPMMASGAALAASGVAAAGAAIAAGTIKVLQLGGELQKTRVAFTTLTGSAAKANATITRLVEDSNRSPFTADQYLRAGKTLVAFGEDADNLGPVLRRIGDLAAGTGKDFNELAIIYGKARVQGRLMGEDVNQILESGIPLITELAKQFGISEGAVKKLVSTGAVSFSHLEKAFINLTKEGGKFGGMMDAQSKTLPGKISTILGNLENLAAKIGEMAAPALSPMLDMITDLLMQGQKLVDWFKGLDQSTLDLAASIAKFIVIMNPIVLPFWLLHKAVSAVWSLIEEGSRRVGPWLALLREEAGKILGRFKPLADTIRNIGVWFSRVFSGAGSVLSDFGANARDVFFKGLIVPIQFAIKLMRVFEISVDGAIELFGDLAFAASGFLEILKVIGSTEFGKLPDPEKLEEAWAKLRGGIDGARATGIETGKRIKEAFQIEFEAKEITEKLNKALKNVQLSKTAPLQGPPIKPPKQEIIGFVTAWQRAFDKQALAGLKAAATLEQRQAAMIKKFTLDAGEFAGLVSSAANQITPLITGAANQEIAAIERVQEKRSWLLDAWNLFAGRQYDRDVEAFERAEDEKLEAARRTHDARLALIDEEFARKKAELESEKERVLAEDEESRARKQEEIEINTANRALELEQIGILDEDALALQRRREQEFAAKLDKLREQRDAKKSEQDAASAAAEEALRKDRERREEESRLRREKREKDHARLVALLEWQAESSSLSVKGQADAQAALIGGVTSAAQAFASIVAAFSVLGPVGFAAGLAVGGTVSALLLAQAAAAAGTARSQSVLPPLAAFAEGGVLRETIGEPGRDSVPAMLMPGETIIDRARTRAMQAFIDRAAPPTTAPATININGDVNFNIAANGSETQIEDINRGFDRLIDARRGGTYKI